MINTKGLHHITAIARKPLQNLDFYTNVLGQRLVKKTVNFDDPGTYHLYYGDEAGSPGTILTFFPWPHIVPGTVGTGETSTVGYRIAKGAVDYWQSRLERRHVPVNESERFGDRILRFEDPDGMAIELIESEIKNSVQFWKDGDIPAEHALQGFHSAVLQLTEVTLTAQLLTDHLGYVFIGQEGDRYRYSSSSGEAGIYIDLVKQPRSVGRFGAGSIHHIAFRAADDDEQAEYLRMLRTAGFQVTPVQDRQYFHSIYFREPGGVLFEIATDNPGFDFDESLKEFGSKLQLPPWLEPRRAEIEATLPALEEETG